MELKDTKIFIPEIPKEYKQRTRSGDTNIWNDSFCKNGLPEIRLEPPIIGLYAESFGDGWYWVCGCSKCLNNNEKYSYIVCEEHDRCITCGTHRNKLTEIPWGNPDGFQCKPCNKKEREEQRTTAIELAREEGLSEDDCCYTDEVICPVCFTENSSDDIDEDRESEYTCCVCDADFIVSVEYEPKYTSKLKKS